MTIASVAASGDRRATLEAMRDKLAADMDAAEPAVVAQIAGRLSAVLVELDALPVSEGSVSERLTDDLAHRRAKAAVVKRAAGSGDNRRKRSS